MEEDCRLGETVKVPVNEQQGDSVSNSLAWRLYVSHFLSTWNSRSFEFGAVLFLAMIYRDTLLQLSIYALVRSASAVLLAPAVGRKVDTGDRLQAVRASIVLGRSSMIVACLLFWAMYTHHFSSGLKTGLFVMVTALACVEKPASVLNLLSVERDWVVVICDKKEDRLRVMNARMRRIDLFCKLAGPLFIALIDGASTTVAIWMTFGTNVLSMPAEYFLIADVYKRETKLQRPKQGTPADSAAIASSSDQQRLISNSTWYFRIFNIFRFYFTHPRWQPSFALALLYLTVLGFGGQMVTYLISAGYTAFIVALVRTLSVVFEMSATWIAPRLMRGVHVARVGMWFLSWQIAWLTAGVVFFWADARPIVAASGLVAATILSRIGLWGYDLCAQFIIQEGVQGDMRGSFSATEASFQNGFELISYVLTIVFSRPDQFRYPVLVSVGAVLTAGAIFANYLRNERGHLTHVELCLKADDAST